MNIATRKKAASTVVDAWLTRLENEFSYELDRYHATRPVSSKAFVKPVEDPYLRLAWTDEDMIWENDQGRLFHSSANARVGMTTRGVLWNRVAWSVRPEWGVSSGQNDLDVIEGYAKLGLGNGEIQVGKDSLSWGPGNHGYLVMSPNTNQLGGFDMSVLVPTEKLLPFRSMKLYADLAGEDEAGWIPTKWAMLYGVQLNDILKTGKTDLIVEYGQTRVSGFPYVFYNHIVEMIAVYDF